MFSYNINFLFLLLCFSVILFISTSTLYLANCNYNEINATIEKSVCNYDKTTNDYICDLTINYTIKNDKITNQIIINSPISYKECDVVKIEYNTNNFLDIRINTFYKNYSLILCLSAIVLLIFSVYVIHKIKENTLDSIFGSNVLDFIRKINLFLNVLT